MNEERGRWELDLNWHLILIGGSAVLIVICIVFGFLIAALWPYRVPVALSVLGLLFLAVGIQGYTHLHKHFMEMRHRKHDLIIKQQNHSAMMGRSQRSYKPEPEPTTANNWRVLAIADAELIGKQTKAKQAEKDKIRDWSDEEAFTYGRQRLGRTNGRVTQEETEGLITEALGGGGENE